MFSYGGGGLRNNVQTQHAQYWFSIVGNQKHSARTMARRLPSKHNHHHSHDLLILLWGEQEWVLWIWLATVQTQILEYLSNIYGLILLYKVVHNTHNIYIIYNARYHDLHFWKYLQFQILILRKPVNVNTRRMTRTFRINEHEIISAPPINY